MKTSAIILSLLIGLGFASCIQQEDIPSINSTETIEETITSTAWRISYFWDSDHEETNHFSAYTFSFENGGVLTATDGSRTYTGTWAEGFDDSTNKLYLNFNSPPDFEEISDDWHILEWTDNQIRLQDVSGGNGGTDELTFTKV